ncbi:MAG: hypothetical protein M4579_004182 [Chaenotheca gracillima]|nr:MAG: hypothetical protein M4579_004182 [Chaenotheca gracillima]
MRFNMLSLIAFATTWSLVSAHTVITYPGWRGDTLKTNDDFPYGMQWEYPCGGLPVTKNRTNWPITGGAIALQPGWFRGHHTAFFYINMGYSNDLSVDILGGPPNMSFPMMPVFQITGPTNEKYDGTICLPQVPLPVNSTARIGDNVTIQVVEVAVHGASLYNCVDVTLTDPKDVDRVTPENCFNSTDISFNTVFSTADVTSAAAPLTSTFANYLGLTPLILVTLFSIFS